MANFAQIDKDTGEVINVIHVDLETPEGVAYFEDPFAKKYDWVDLTQEHAKYEPQETKPWIGDTYDKESEVFEAAVADVAEAVVADVK